MITETDWEEIDRVCGLAQSDKNVDDFTSRARLLLPLLAEELRRVTNVETKLIRFAQSVGARKVEELEERIESLEHVIDRLRLELAKATRVTA